MGLLACRKNIDADAQPVTCGKPRNMSPIGSAMKNNVCQNFSRDCKQPDGGQQNPYRHPFKFKTLHAAIIMPRPPEKIHNPENGVSSKFDPRGPVGEP